VSDAAVVRMANGDRVVETSFPPARE
jgi:hypothetical protein